MITDEKIKSIQIVIDMLREARLCSDKKSDIDAAIEVLEQDIATEYATRALVDKIAVKIDDEEDKKF